MKRQADTERKLYTLCILVQDIPGVLSQVARLFSRKGYNIESIVSGETDKPGITRITIGILADQTMLEQIAAQCSKLLPVTAVKVAAADRGARDEVIQLANIFRAKVIDVSRESLTLGIFGSNSKITALIGMLTDFGILEIAKTGTIAIERGKNTIYDDNKLKEEYDYGKHVL